MTIPASIRYNNPGAMWGGNAISKKWGETKDVILVDGQGNHIANFPDPVKGAAAQFDLWRASYCDKTLKQAITRWCGGNSPDAYVQTIGAAADIRPSDFITRDLLAGPKGLALMKAQAAWEAGKPYPLTDAEWKKAQGLVFKLSTATHAAAGGAVVVATAGAAHYATSLTHVILYLGVGLAVAALVYYTQWRKK